ncbi:MAG: HAMP domain-containing sensor histidine kinase [Candidatus Faecimonas sp.]|nr:HAMP domain-containing histidine kinase [Mycoplasmatota bacterium]MDY2908078.1 HAMP domain-containing sensor histidine kinase [Candidatus Faecimonas sp.]
MSIFESLTINLIFLLFPFLIYAIYISYRNNTKDEKLVFDFVIFSAMFLLIRYTKTEDSIASLIFINFPLLIAVMKKRSLLVIMLSIITIYYYHQMIKIPLSYGIIEYSIYIMLYFSMLKKSSMNSVILNIFISIKSFITACYLCIKDLNNILTPQIFLYLLFIILLFIITITSILWLLKEGEKIIEKNRALRELEREKELKLALFKLTHEIKNPIAVCKGYLEMVNIENKEKLKKYLPIIKDEINRTLLVINDFSDYGKLQIDKEEVDLEMLLDDIKETLEPLLKEKKVKANFIIKEEELYAELDYNRMKQVLINLIKNAIEAKDDERQLKITTTIKKVKEEIQIKVEDTGIGISKENLEKIDKIFYTTKEHGTGIGVALSKEIVERHKGSIIYQSTLGKGTKVTILLPIKEN